MYSFGTIYKFAPPYLRKLEEITVYLEAMCLTLQILGYKTVSELQTKHSI